MTERAKIGMKIKALREVQGITLTELADQSGLSKGYLSTIEAGAPDANPTLDALVKIAGALDVTVGELVGTQRRARMTLDLPDDQLPPALLELVKERRAEGAPLDPHTVSWLAHAKFRGKKPATKDQFSLLLTVVGEGRR